MCCSFITLNCMIEVGLHAAKHDTPNVMNYNKNQNYTRASAFYHAVCIRLL